jgi:hypothetical protein
MKLECTVKRVSESGETVSIAMDGRQRNDAEWRRDGDITIEVTSSAKVRRAFYLGRKVTIAVQPK